jgi:hypothetical protein
MDIAVGIREVEDTVFIGDNFGEGDPNEMLIYNTSINTSFLAFSESIRPEYIFMSRDRGENFCYKIWAPDSVAYLDQPETRPPPALGTEKFVYGNILYGGDSARVFMFRKNDDKVYYADIDDPESSVSVSDMSDESLSESDGVGSPQSENSIDSQSEISPDESILSNSSDSSGVRGRCWIEIGPEWNEVTLPGTPNDWDTKLNIGDSAVVGSCLTIMIPGADGSIYVSTNNGEEWDEREPETPWKDSGFILFVKHVEGSIWVAGWVENLSEEGSEEEGFNLVASGRTLILYTIDNGENWSYYVIWSRGLLSEGSEIEPLQNAIDFDGLSNMAGTGLFSKDDGGTLFVHSKGKIARNIEANIGGPWESVYEDDEDKENPTFPRQYDFIDYQSKIIQTLIYTDDDGTFYMSFDQEMVPQNDGGVNGAPPNWELRKPLQQQEGYISDPENGLPSSRTHYRGAAKLPSEEDVISPNRVVGDNQIDVISYAEDVGAYQSSSWESGPTKLCRRCYNTTKEFPYAIIKVYGMQGHFIAYGFDKDDIDNTINVIIDHTPDNGANWERVAILNNTTFYNEEFLNIKSAVAFMHESVSEDNECIEGNVPEYPIRIVFITDSDNWLLYDYINHTLTVVEPGGVIPAANQMTRWHHIAAANPSENEVVVAGQGGFFFSCDGGSTWEIIFLNGGRTYYIEFDEDLGTWFRTWDSALHGFSISWSDYGQHIEATYKIGSGGDTSHPAYGKITYDETLGHFWIHGGNTVFWSWRGIAGNIHNPRHQQEPGFPNYSQGIINAPWSLIQDFKWGRSGDAGEKPWEEHLHVFRVVSNENQESLLNVVDQEGTLSVLKAHQSSTGLEFPVTFVQINSGINTGDSNSSSSSSGSSASAVTFSSSSNSISSDIIPPGAGENSPSSESSITFSSLSSKSSSSRSEFTCSSESSTSLSSESTSSETSSTPTSESELSNLALDLFRDLRDIPTLPLPSFHVEEDDNSSWSINNISKNTIDAYCDFDDEAITSMSFSMDNDTEEILIINVNHNMTGSGYISVFIDGHRIIHNNLINKSQHETVVVEPGTSNFHIVLYNNKNSACLSFSVNII